MASIADRKQVTVNRMPSGYRKLTSVLRQPTNLFVPRDALLAAAGNGASSGGVNGARRRPREMRNGRRPELGSELLRMRAPRFDIAS